MAKSVAAPPGWRGLVLRRLAFMDRSHKVDISGLLAGSRQLMVVADEVPIEPFEGVVFPEPVRVKLELRQADRMLVVEGSVDARVHGQCDACLEDVDLQIHVDVDERLDPAHGRDVDPFGESNVLTGNGSTWPIWRSRACSALCRWDCDAARVPGPLRRPAGRTGIRANARASPRNFYL